MLVVDSAALVQYLTGRDDTAKRVRERLTGVSLAAPQGVDLEVISGIRGLVLGGKVRGNDGQEALALLSHMDIRRYEIAVLTDRIWELRQNMWPYDAAFGALAEALAIPLVSIDSKFTRTPGIRCAVEVLT